MTQLGYLGVCLTIGCAALAPLSAWADTASGHRGVVATVHPIATDAALSVLQSGGNAIDAAVSAALTLGVVNSHNSGLGGGCFIVLRCANNEPRFVAIDGRETAPGLATRDLYIERGRQTGTAPTKLSQNGPLAVAVPGALAAYVEVLDRYGSKTLSELISPAAEVAERGFAIDSAFARSIRQTRDLLLADPGASQVLLKADGAPYERGETLKQPDLARTYRQIAAHGSDWFYRGEFAERVASHLQSLGGILAVRDFRVYGSIHREPIVTTYRGYAIVGMPPPSSGGVHVAQILNILERFDLRRLHDEDPAKFMHVVGEAMKLAFADRAHWLGDADFARVPLGLVRKDYAAELAKRIDVDRARNVPRHGMPAGYETEFFAPRHTTHIAVADAKGNWVGITATVNTTFGSKVMVPGTGLILNNEMDDFSVRPGMPNAFGLIGAEANSIAPGKRPLSSMSPTIILKDGVPVMTVGAAGGPRIITQVVLAIIRCIDLEMSLEQAIAAPRYHHQWRPDRLMFERRFGADLPWALANRGHIIGQTRSGGTSQGIWRSPEGTFVAVSDPRVSGKAAGY